MEAGKEKTVVNQIDVNTDWFLNYLVRVVNESDLSFGITLTVKGMIISGMLIGGKKFFEKGGRNWIMGWEKQSPEIREAFETALKRAAEILLRSLNSSHFAEPVPGLAINSPWPMGTIIRSE